MDDIARHLGISKKTIYLHFLDKDTIVTKVVEHQLLQKKALCEQICGNLNDPLKELLSRNEELNLQFGNVHEMLLSELKKYYPTAWNLYNNYKNEYFIEKIKNNLTRGIKAGLYRNDLNIDIVAGLSLGQMGFSHDSSIFPSGKFKAEEVKTQMLHHFVRGLLSENGLAIYNQYLGQHHDTF